MATSSIRPRAAGLALAALLGFGVTQGVVYSPSFAAPGVVADLRADTDRDGRVDLTGGTDESVEATSRVIVLPNLDDDAGRCPALTRQDYAGPTAGPDAGAKAAKATKQRRAQEGAGLPSQAQLKAYAQRDQELDACHDAADEIVNSEVDARDLSPVHVVANPGVAPTATGAITVSNDRFRVFVKTPAGWQVVTSETRFNAEQLKAGLQLGVEAKDIARDRAVWDGTATLSLTVTAGADSSIDAVQLAVAPVLTHHHLQRAEQLLTMAADKHQPAQVPFNRDLETGAAKAKVPGGVRAMPGDEVWQQDQQEPAYVSMPTPEGTHAIRLLVRSDQLRVGQRALYALRGQDVGVIWMGRPGKESTYDSMGNLETIPPFTHNGRSFPAGRIVLGDNPASGLGPTERSRRLWAAQGQADGGLQQPLMLDTGWLGVGHVDEFVTFVPADTDRGWKVVLADPRGALELVRQAKRAGLGDQALSTMEPKITGDVVLRKGRKGGLDANRFAEQKINENLDRIKAATGITEADIVRVPVLFRGGYAKDGMPIELGALVPDAVNAPIVNGYVLAPKQHSITVKGRDLFAEAVRRSYADAGITVSFVEDLKSHHTGGGEVHCGTNTLREMSQSWW